MELVRIARRLFEGGERPDPARLRSCKPIRNEFVTSSPADDGGLVLTAPLETQGRGMAAVLAKKMNMPGSKSFELDPVGAFVWDLCDGKNSFEAIGRKLKDRYQMNRLEAETALAEYLKTLSQRRLIAVAEGPKK